MSSKSPLGRGLSSLIPNKPLQDPSTSKVPESESTQVNVSSVSSSDILAQPHELDVSLITPNPFQPRYEFRVEDIDNLAQSILDKGILQPLVITPVGDGKYQLIAGERRLRAAKKAGLKTVPVVVRTNVSDQDKAELALIENIQRQNLNAIERAKGYRDLQETFQLTQEQIAEKMALSRSSVANTLRYLTLPQSVQNALAGDVITEGHAKIIAGVASPALQEKILENIIKHSLNVRETEKVAKQDPSKIMNIIEPEVKTWMAQVADKINNKVEVRKKGKRYIVTMNFFSEQEIERFSQYFNQEKE